MGLLDKIFGNEKKEYPLLEPTNPIAGRIEHFRGNLESLAKDVSDPIEVIPTEKAAYVFLGKPPKRFGIAWIKDGKIYNLKTLSQEQGIPEMKIQLMSEKLRKAYEKSDGASRFSTTVADKTIVVTNSDSLQKDLEKIIEH